VGAASTRLQRIPGAQVVTLAEMMGTFLNLVGAARTLVAAVAAVAIAVGALGVFNTMMAAVLERTTEMGVLRAVGAGGVWALIWLETVALCALGGAAGLIGAAAFARFVETWLRTRLPFAPDGALVRTEFSVALLCLLGSVLLGTLAALLPAWRAARLSPVEAIRATNGA